MRKVWVHQGFERLAPRLVGMALCVALVGANAPGTFAEGDRPCAVTTPMVDGKFVPGQVWSFKSREFEPDATVTILKIESLPKIGEIIHVRVDGIRLRNCTGGPEPTTVQHAPFTREAIERSAGKLMRTGAVPDFGDGYAEWKAHCGGVYTITVIEMVVVDEKTYNKGFGCSV